MNNPKMMNIIVVSDKDTWTYRVKTSQNLAEFSEKIARRKSLNVENLQFILPNGNKIGGSSSNTFNDCGLKDCDELRVVITST